MTRIIAIANRKGGTGKTTVAINLGAALAEQGKRVLLIDLDEQANCTSGVGIDEPTHGHFRTVADLLLTPETDPAEIIQATSFPNLSIIPSSNALRGVNEKLAEIVGAELLLKEAIAKIHGYDFILLDCPPAVNRLTTNALVAAQEVLVPIQTGKWALDGTKELFRTMQGVRARLNPPLDVVGVVLTFYDPRTSLSREILRLLEEQFQERLFQTHIRTATKIGESTLAHVPVLAYASRSEAAQGFRSLASELLQR